MEFDLTHYLTQLFHSVDLFALLLQYFLNPLYCFSHIVEYDISFKSNGLAIGSDFLIRTNQGVGDIRVHYHLRGLFKIWFELIRLINTVNTVGRKTVDEELKKRVENMRHEKYLHFVNSSLDYFISIGFAH